jgi:hypothetical protein
LPGIRLQRPVDTVEFSERLPGELNVLPTSFSGGS